MKYIYQQPDWPNLYWDSKQLYKQLADLRYQQGLFLGRMSSIGFNIQSEASLETLTTNILKSSAIEGEYLDQQEVRSSVASHLGMDIGCVLHAQKHIDGLVEMTLDAIQNHKKPLTKERLCYWHQLLFPRQENSMLSISVGEWRPKSAGPMRVVSGAIGRERVHFEAPLAENLNREMQRFLDWFHKTQDIDDLLKAGIAHFWFVTVHPFEDGNGRIARAIADMCLAKADKVSNRFYSMSAQIEKERKHYYDILEKTQKGGLDITQWLLWFLECLSSAVSGAEKVLENILFKARVWEHLKHKPINKRQQKVINRLFENFEGNLTTSKYAKLAKCSQDTALRDIKELMDYGVMRQNPGGGRNVSYVLFPSS